MTLTAAAMLTAFLGAAHAQDPVDAAKEVLETTPEGEDEGEIVVGTRTTEFEDDFYVQRDIMLQGITAIETVNFPTPVAWDMQADPEVTLVFSHSGSNSPNRSSLSMSINGVALASTPLDAANVIDGELKARIPVDALQPYNQLKLQVIQHIDDECEDPFDPALWTRVSRKSTVDWTFERDPASTELGEFPLTVFDEHGYGPLEVALAGANQLSAGQLEALGILGFSLGRHAAYRHVQLQDPVADLSSGPPQHLLVVGTPAENPLVGQLIGQGPAAGEGLVALKQHPRDPRFGIVIVTGGDAAGLRKAAEAVVGDNRKQVLSGSASAVQALSDFVQTPTRQDPLPAPRKQTQFTLKDLDVEDITVRGYYAPPVTIPLMLEGDAHVQIEGARVGIDYAYSAHLDTRLSTMEVRLNGVTLRSVQLDDPDGEEKQRLWVDLPFELMEPHSQLEVVFHLFPNDFSPCVYTTDRHIWATVYGSTEFRLHRDHYAMLPDLSLLRYNLWPYGEAMEAGGLQIVTADQPDAWDGTGVLQVAAELGRKTVVERPKLSVVAARAGTLSGAPASHHILLVADTPHSTHDGLVRQKALAQDGTLERKIREDGSDVMGARVGAAYGTIEQVVSPVGEGRTILVLKAPNRQDLDDVARTLQDEGLLRSLDGSAAVLGDEGGARSMELTKPQQVGIIPLSSRIRAFIRGQWLLLGVAVLLAAGLLAFVVMAWASRRGGQA
jgi:hypothetical protein